MLGHVYANPDIIKKVHFAQDLKESTVDIYVSAESLRVYENPWVEDTPGPAEAQQRATSVLSESSGQRHHIRISMFLAAACLLLLAGIIVIGVQKRDQLSAVHADLRKTTERLTANITILSRERDALWGRFCPIVSSFPCTPEDPQKAISVNVPSEGRNLLRPAAMFLLLLCLLFLAGFVVLVVLLIQDKGLNANLTRTRDELQTSYGEMKSLYANLTRTRDELQTGYGEMKSLNANLTRTRDELQTSYGEMKSLNANLTRTRDELQTGYGEMKSLNANLTQKTNRLENEKDHLKAIESNLTTEIDELKQQLAGRSCSPEDWDKFGKNCYLISNSKKNWEESKSFCEDLNAQLVIISSQQEQNFISSFHVKFWIGLRHEGGEIWKWVNGSVAMQTYWEDGQPDYYMDREHCATLQRFDSFESWNDLTCNTKRNFVCEKIPE